MTNKIALTASMRSNLLSLQSTQKLFDSTQDRLASGYKVNSAMDNPSSYFTAQALNSRANDLSGLLDSIGQAISTLQTADQGITTLQSFVEQAKSIANNARDTANVASKATTNNVKFDPDNARTDLLSDYVNVTAGPTNKVQASSLTVDADDAFASLFTTGSDIDITVGDDTQHYTTASASTVQEFLDKVAQDFEGRVKAELVDGHMTFTTLDNSDITISGTRGTETHTSNTADFAGLDLADLTALTIDGNAVTLPATMTLENLTAKINAELGANGIVASYDGDVLTIKDTTVGNTGAPAIVATGISPTITDGATFTVEKPGTSGAENLGFSYKTEGTSNAVSSFAIRTGDATKMVGTANLRADKTLEELGMADGQSIDIIVGDQVHTYTIGDGEGQTAKTSTLQQFMDNIVYDIGRTKIKAEIVDGVMTISTLDNSTLSIRSSNQKETIDTTALSATAIKDFLDADPENNTLTDVKITPATTGAVAITVSLTGVTTPQGIVDAINNDANIQAAGITAELDSLGNIAIYDTNADNGVPTVVLDVDEDGTPDTQNGTAGVKDKEVKGTSFNDLVGFKADQIVEVTEDMTVEQFRQAINNLDGVSADFDTKGHLVISGEQGDDLVMVNSANSNVLKNLYGSDVVSATNGSNERAKYAAQFDDILSQVDQLVQDTSYKGINLLNGDDLTVVFNESRTSTLELKGVTFDSTGLGFTRSINEWISNEDIDKALTQITKATSLLRAQASEFGQNLSTVQIREDFTQNMINNLQSGADKLTLADMNEEAANMLALQTRQQLATNSLSLANQAAQSVLRLF